MVPSCAAATAAGRGMRFQVPSLPSSGFLPKFPLGPEPGPAQRVKAPLQQAFYRDPPAARAEEWRWGLSRGAVDSCSPPLAAAAMQNKQHFFALPG